MFDAILSRIPNDEPDLKIGALSIWVIGYTYINQKGQGDNTYLNTPTLLITEDMVIFSKRSDTAIFNFKRFLKDLLFAYENVAIAHVFEFASDNSQFHIKLTSGGFGQIRVNIKYYQWGHHNGSLDFEETIDQSYLPKMMNEVRSILTKEY